MFTVNRLSVRTFFKINITLINQVLTKSLKMLVKLDFINYETDSDTKSKEEFFVFLKNVLYSLESYTYPNPFCTSQ